MRTTPLSIRSILALLTLLIFSFSTAKADGHPPVIELKEVLLTMAITEDFGAGAHWAVTAELIDSGLTSEDQEVSVSIEYAYGYRDNGANWRRGSEIVTQARPASMNQANIDARGEEPITFTVFQRTASDPTAGHTAGGGGSPICT